MILLGERVFGLGKLNDWPRRVLLALRAWDETASQSFPRVDCRSWRARSRGIAPSSVARSFGFRHDGWSPRRVARCQRRHRDRVRSFIWASRIFIERLCFRKGLSRFKA
ncbi:MAG: hypothetical protein M2R46_02297 [Verrucomicrobia subdivision 3 bacterium]|nr:hypothetical protein [Limisphaerales bacterium]